MDRIEVTPDITGADAPGSNQNPQQGQQQQAGQQGQQQGQPNDQQRPGWLPEKFKSPEDLAKAYSELEKKLGSQGQQQQGQQQQQAGQQGQNQNPQQGQQQGQQQAGDTNPFGKFEQEFAEKGELSEDSYKELQTKHGLSRSMVDHYIRGREAEVQQQLTDFHNVVGGKDKYEAMAEWALQTLSPEERESYNQAVTKGDPIQVKWAIQGLYARFERENGSGAPATRITGSRAQGSIQPFRSNHELIAAMSDPRYKQGDPAYHAEVEQRLAISNI